jgi:hypothetical protein
MISMETAVGVLIGSGAKLNAAQLGYSRADAADRACRASSGAGPIGINLISAHRVRKSTEQFETIR